MKKRILSMLVLLVAVVSGAWAQEPATTYKVTLQEGTEDSGKWTISPTEAAEGATVTATYSGEKKVKSVKAVKKEVGPEVSTFSELQAVLSAGKDVKLMKDIVCTAEIDITSEGALTIDGNGKMLSTTSAIRAFKVESPATVAFKNLTITGFVNEGGPAINNSGTIVLDGCTISNCHVNNSNGGGAIESTGKLYAVNTTFSGNYSGEIGGAINNYWGNLYMTDCTFTDNYTTSSDAFYGGAIGINRGSEVRLINCSFSGNKYGTNTGINDIGVYSKPGNYTIAGCKGVTIASDDGDITTIASGTATLDYSDLSNISFTYSAPITTTLNNTIKAWTAGSYAVPTGGLTYSDAITVSGDVTLTLTDGQTLTLNKGISLASGATLTVEGNGTMNINGTNNSTASTVAGSGTLVLTSGTLTATGGNGGNGADESHGGNGGDAINGSVIVSGGTLTARGGNGGNSAYGAYDSHGGNGGDAISGSVIVNGGTLTATGGNGGSVGINGYECSGGNGGDAISGTLTINGGSTSGNDGSNGSIGSGCDYCTAGTGGKGHN